MSTTYFTSDPHAAIRNTRANDLTPEGYRLMLEFSGMVIQQKAAWYLLGDGLEGLGCSTVPLIRSNETFLRAIASALSGWAVGNHDPDLPLDWQKELKMARSFDLVIDEQEVHVEHGDRYDKENWRSLKWKVGARAAYFVEEHFWQDCDEEFSKFWHRWQAWQDAQRRARNGPETAGLHPCWWVAQRLSAEVCPKADVIVLGHSHRRCDERIRPGLRHIDAGSWTRDPQGKPRLDVTRCKDGVWTQGHVKTYLAEAGIAV